MPPAQPVPGIKIVRALERAGFKLARISGSHHVMRHPDGRGASVPVHRGRDVPRGTVASILRDTGLTMDDL